MAVAKIGERSAHKSTAASKTKPKKPSAFGKKKPASGRWGSTHDKFNAGHGGKKPPGAR